MTMNPKFADSDRSTSASDAKRVGATDCRNRSHSSGIAFSVLAMLLLAVSGYSAWQLWHTQAVDVTRLHALEQRVDVLEKSLAQLAHHTSAWDQNLHVTDQANHVLQEQLLTQNYRIQTLERSLGALSEKWLAGHDALALDDTESLLRMGQQRYQLFHDARGAARAYAMAGKSLASVKNPAFSDLRQDIDDVRRALLQGHPVRRDRVLASLSQLRTEALVVPIQTSSPDSVPVRGVWRHLKRALFSVVSIHRTHQALLFTTNANLVHEWLDLDLMQAQLAVLAADTKTAHVALRHVQSLLATCCDNGSALVQKMHARLNDLFKQIRAVPVVQLGGVLERLQARRQELTLHPGSTPISSSISGHQR